MLYKAYGKVIWSDISFTQLLVEEEKTESELEIKIAKIDEDMKSYIEAHKGPGGKGDGFCWINTPGGYFVVRGNQILTESNTEEQHEKMRSYILGYGLSLLFSNSFNILKVDKNFDSACLKIIELFLLLSIVNKKSSASFNFEKNEFKLTLYFVFFNIYE